MQKKIEKAYEEWQLNVCWETAFKNQNDAAEDAFKAGYEAAMEEMKPKKTYCEECGAEEGWSTYHKPNCSNIPF